MDLTAEREPVDSQDPRRTELALAAQPRRCYAGPALVQPGEATGKGAQGQGAVTALTEIAPGIFQVRVPVPFALRDVTCYLLRERDGWTLIDCGLHDPAAHAAWEEAISAPLGRREPS